MLVTIGTKRVNKTIISLTLVGAIAASSGLCTSLVIYHHIYNMRQRSNC